MSKKKSTPTPKRQIITVSEIAELHETDVSYVSKRIKFHKIKTIQVKLVSNGKIANAISMEDYKKLLELQPTFTSTALTARDMPVLKAQELLNISPRGLRSICEKKGIKYVSRYDSKKKKSVKVISKKDFNKIKNSRTEVVLLDDTVPVK